MDTDALRWFQQVADGTTVTEVSELEGVTQSGVSRALARLETEVGTPLLQRSGRVETLLADVQQVARGHRQYQKKGDNRVAGDDQRMPRALRAAARRRDFDTVRLQRLPRSSSRASFCAPLARLPCRFSCSRWEQEPRSSC